MAVVAVDVVAVVEVSVGVVVVVLDVHESQRIGHSA